MFRPKPGGLIKPSPPPAPPKINKQKRKEQQVTVQEHLALLGHEVEDKVSDYKGIVISICYDLYGCIQADVRPKELDKEGKMKQGHWLDVNRLIVTSKKPLMDQPEFMADPPGPSDKPAMETPISFK